MGMSASQARFLCLTARKSNVEFEGQQINQQRTTLSNESANYYSELCNMVVPTPPSVDDYTKVTYTFNDGALTNTITSMIAKGNNWYNISYVQQWQDDYSIVAAASSVISKSDDGNFFIGTNQLRELTDDKQLSVARTILIDTTTYPVKYGAIKYVDENEIKDEDGNILYKTQQDSEGKDITGYYYTTKKDIITKNTNNPKDDYNNVRFVKYNENGTIADNKSWDEFLQENNISVPSPLTEDFINTLNKSGYTPCIIDRNQTNYKYFSSDVEFAIDGTDLIYYILEHEEIDEYHALDSEQLEQIQTVDSVDKDKLAMEASYKNLLNQKYNNGEEADWYVRYITDSTTGAEVPYFYKKSEVENAHFGDNGYALNSIKCYSIGSTTETKEILNQLGTVTKDSAGRYISISIYEDGESGAYVTYDLTTNTITDEEAYNDAMNKYNYEQHQYDKKIQDINSKLEIVQQQDKSLELNLKQLDTEENAITTEMEAVKKVISKNVEQSFKTFEA